ncbi:MAG TPA: nuclear transport factor 2 family protein [Aeromicrobium sp.]|nr:nuclear transport factor 2 family protein [Aeromicrobium sp.]
MVVPDLAREMFAAWDTLDWDKVVALFAEDGVLHSVMQEPVVGRAAIAERMAVLAKATRIELQIEALGIIDGRVFVQRVDDFDYEGHHGRVPVVGVISMADGQITEWLEYYDRPTLLAGLGMSADFVG